MSKEFNAEVDACIAEKISKLAFPTPKDGKQVKVSCPFTCSR